MMSLTRKSTNCPLSNRRQSAAKGDLCTTRFSRNRRHIRHYVQAEIRFGQRLSNRKPPLWLPAFAGTTGRMEMWAYNRSEKH